ncbi:3-deoxy-D-manno-octulosonic acid transferase [Thalassovita mangrovi]|uniref:3-deoxy-D-manno-octulosonic acid transferase n=1 Tax=Thalassovita mangrovi TaxID=2692236 RepID=A0A6L8LEP9_9RHOB|nr:glycosyltransferase N-terminal domain-containing protein [Thalassovita mangrovi]MYM54541.1 3-deoxy-D-manno-octulosonic acid transferase [Thalassovita mangrovi]
MIRISGLMRLYLGLTALAPGLLTRAARKAHVKQGGDPGRFGERLGRATAQRPEGRLIWFHAASVGELLSVLKLAGDLAADTGSHLLFTTATTTAADLAAQRMPEGAIHQYLPVDSAAAVDRFLTHWAPNMACFVESDLWPRLVLRSAARGIPMALINTRFSKSRARTPRTSAALLDRFALITAQDEAAADQLRSLGVPPARPHVPGDLKAALLPPPVDAAALSDLQQATGTRPVWIAASTHAEDEPEILAAHAAALNERPDLLLILMPRHPERAAEIAALPQMAGMRWAQRSKSQTVTDDTQLYLADTLGEMGAFLSLSPVVFLGGSFGKQGGHNPFEPAQFGAVVLHGPHVANFAESYAEMADAGIAHQVPDGAELGHAVLHWLEAPDLPARQAAARAFMADKQHIAEETRALLRALLLAHPGAAA